MLRWFRRRRLSEAGRRRFLIALARAEETLVETHARNVLEVYDAVGEELPLETVLELYLGAVDPGEPQSAIIARRVMARPERRAPRSRGRGRLRRVDG
ncbi:MAG: hypothetical protein ACRELX_12250 [Longimicrobiales bacterium]